MLGRQRICRIVQGSGSAALTIFIGKCERDAQASCDATAAERKLTGAASFTTKCVNDAVGAR